MGMTDDDHASSSETQSWWADRTTPLDAVQNVDIICGVESILLPVAGPHQSTQGIDKQDAHPTA